MDRKPEANDHVLAVLLSRASHQAGVSLAKTENNSYNLGITPALALAMAMRDIRLNK